MEETNQTPPTPPNLGGPGQNQQKNTGMAIVAYILFFIPLLTDAKNDPFVKFHIKQGLVLFIGWFIAMILWWTPLFMIAWLLDLGLLVLLIIGIMNAMNAKEQELPLIGKFGKNFNF